MLGMGPEARGDQIDADLLNAGKIPVTALARGLRRSRWLRPSPEGMTAACAGRLCL